MIKGCDLAFPIQGELTEAVWQALEEEGIKFAIMRLVVGNNPGTDTAAVARHLPRAKAHGILPGAYFFPFPLPHLKPRDQVERFVRELEALGGLGMNPGELPPAIDCEWPEREKREADGSLSSPWKKWGCSATQIREWIEEAILIGEELTGITWIRYTYRYWLKCIEGEKSSILGAGPLWLADYTYSGRWVDDAGLAKLVSPSPWDRITIVQHDGNGGMKLPNGRDADFNMFHGTEEELRALASGVGKLPHLRHPTAAEMAEAAAAEMAALTASAHADAADLITEDMIAEYRRSRITA